MIDEQEISDRIHAAFEMEPLPGGFQRLWAELDSRTRSRRTPTRMPSLRRWAPLLAAFVAVAIAASAIAYGIHTRAVPAKNSPPSGFAVRAILGGWYYSANDAAVQLQAPPSGRAHVLITHDAGRSWVRTPLNSDRISIRWIDSMHLVATGDNVGPPFLFASSSDGGATWHETVLPNLLPWNLATFFLNAREGWALCNSFRACLDGSQRPLLYHSVDSGASWQPISVVTASPSITPLWAYFVDSHHGFIATMNSSGAATLLMTVDGGVTWRVETLPLSRGTPGSYAVDCGASTCVDTPTMFGLRGVITVQSANSGLFTFTTADGGVTWSNRNPLPGGYGPPLGPNLAPLDPTTWWSVDSTGALYRTNDAGVSWQMVATVVPDGGQLRSVTPTGGGVLWGATVQYPVRSTDGGATWSIVELPNPG